MNTRDIRRVKKSKQVSYNLFNNKKDLNLNLNKKKILTYKDSFLEKSKIRFYYGFFKEKQFKNIYKTAKKHKSNFDKNLLSILESKLDIVIVKMGFAGSVFEAKQIINHKKVQVNGRIISNSSFFLKNSDVITIKNNIFIQEKSKVQNNYIVDYRTLTGVYINKKVTNKDLNINNDLLPFFYK